MEPAETLYQQGEDSGKRRGVRRRAANNRKAHAFYGTLRKSQRRKNFYLDPKTESWQEKTCALAAMESFPMEWVRRLTPTGDAFVFAPHHWIVEAKSNGVVEVSLWLYMVAFVQGEIQSVQAKEWTIACDYPHGKVEAWPMALLRERTNGWLHSFTCSASRLYTEMIGASSVEIPTVVTEAAISFMQDFAKREFGFRPTCPGNIHGLRHMIAFCYRPLDLNIHLLRKAYNGMRRRKNAFTGRLRCCPRVFAGPSVRRLGTIAQPRCR